MTCNCLENRPIAQKFPEMDFCLKNKCLVENTLIRFPKRFKFLINTCSADISQSTKTSQTQTECDLNVVKAYWSQPYKKVVFCSHIVERNKPILTLLIICSSGIALMNFDLVASNMAGLHADCGANGGPKVNGEFLSPIRLEFSGAYCWQTDTIIETHW